MGGIKSGATGCILLMIAAVMILVLSIIVIASPITLLQLWYLITNSVTGMILAVSVLLVSKGTRLLGKYYASGLPNASGIVGLVAGIIMFVGTILGLVAAIVNLFVLLPIIATAAGIMNLVALILVGVFLILLGVTFVVLRVKTGQSGLAMGAGIMAIISGAMFCSVLIVFIGIIILIPTAILAALLFMRVKGVPSEEAPKEGKKLAVKAVGAKPKKQKPADVEAEVYKYVKSHPSGIDVADCAESLGVSEGEVQKSINALVKKGKLELG